VSIFENQSSLLVLFRFSALGNES